MKKLHQHLTSKVPWYKEWHANPGHELIHFGFGILITVFFLSLLITANSSTAATLASVPPTAAYVPMYIPAPTAVVPTVSTPAPAVTTSATATLVGQKITLVKNANVRISAVVSKETLLGVDPKGTTGTVVDGPSTSADGTLWWKVDFTIGFDGWVTADNFKVPASAETTTTAAAPTSAVSANPLMPLVTITHPGPYVYVQNNAVTTITASVNPSLSPAIVDFYVNGVFICGDTTAPYTCNWPVPGTASSYGIYAQAYDDNGTPTTSPITYVLAQ